MSVAVIDVEGIYALLQLIIIKKYCTKHKCFCDSGVTETDSRPTIEINDIHTELCTQYQYRQSALISQV